MQKLFGATIWNRFEHEWLCQRLRVCRSAGESRYSLL